jgi:hypothetical protein
MDHTLSCPSCGGKVRVPDTLAGRSVRCPRCQATFRAQAPDDVVDDVEVVEETPAPRRRRPAPPPEDEHEDRPRPRRQPRDEEYEEEFDDYRPRRASRREIRDRVQGPATALLVSGWIGVALCVVSAVYFVVVFGIAFSKLGELQRQGARVNWGYVIGMLVGEIVALAISIALAWGVISGANQMKSLGDLGAARRAAILALIPCSGCWLIGLPVGIWALIVLGDSQVQRAFGK